MGGIGERNCKARTRWNSDEKVRLARQAVAPAMTAELLRKAEPLQEFSPDDARYLSMHANLWREIHAAVESGDLPTQEELQNVVPILPRMRVPSGHWPIHLPNQQEIGAVVALRISELAGESAPFLAAVSAAAKTSVLDRAADVIRCTLCRLVVDVDGLSGAGFVAEAHPIAVEPFRPTRRASLPRLDEITTEDAASMPTWPSAGGDEQLLLPSFSPEVRQVPFLLWAFDRAGGESMRQGRGAPWELRLWIEALLGLPIANRNGQWHTLQYPLREVIAMLHPNGWANQRRDWQRLPEALQRMRSHLSDLPVEGVGSVALVFPSVIPNHPTDPGVEFTVRIPATAARGARVDIKRLRDYGVQSAVLYRAYLTVATLLDVTARRGQPITRQIGRPELDADGKRMRRPGGSVVRSQELMPHPMARLQKVFTDRAAASLIGFDPGSSDHRRKTRAALGRLHDDNVIELQPSGGRGSFRIFGPAE